MLHLVDGTLHIRAAISFTVCCALISKLWDVMIHDSHLPTRPSAKIFPERNIEEISVDYCASEMVRFIQLTMNAFGSISCPLLSSGSSMFSESLLPVLLLLNLPQEAVQ